MTRFVALVFLVLSKHVAQRIHLRHNTILLTNVQSMISSIKHRGEKQFWICDIFLTGSIMQDAAFNFVGTSLHRTVILNKHNLENNSSVTNMIDSGGKE